MSQDVLCAAEPTALARYGAETEPSAVALGAAHVCYAAGAAGWFQPLGGARALRRLHRFIGKHEGHQKVVFGNLDCRSILNLFCASS